jgi:hypothetical protein
MESGKREKDPQNREAPPPAAAITRVGAWDVGHDYADRSLRRPVSSSSYVRLPIHAEKILKSLFALEMHILRV